MPTMFRWSFDFVSKPSGRRSRRGNSDSSRNANRVLTKIFVCLFAVVPGAAVLAEDAKPADKAEMKITYVDHVLPLLREKCGSCHNANDKKGDLVVDNFTALMLGGGSGAVVATDGDAEGSTLYRVVAHLSEPIMPPGQPKLPDEQLNLIKKWIEGGALENSGSVAKIKKNAVTKVVVSSERPAGPPPMPENLPLDPIITSPSANAVTALAVNPWSTLAAVSGHTQVLLYNTQTMELVAVLPFPEGTPHVLRFSRNGSLLLAAGGRGGHSGRVVLFDVKTGTRTAEIGSEYDAVLAADVSPDHSLVALGGPKKLVRIFDVATGEQLYEMKKHTDWVTAMQFSPDGVLLATGDRSNGLMVWEASTGREFYNLTGHTGMITDVSWRPDSNVLASASEDTTVRLWDMNSGNQIKQFGAHGGGTWGVDFSRDARMVTTGRDNSAKLWTINGDAVRTFGGLPDLGMKVAFCSETDRALAGDLAGNVHLWNAADGAAIGKLVTNPPSLASRIQTTQQELAQAEAAAKQAADQLAALQKGIADRKAAAEAAMKQAANALAAVDPAAKAKVAADTVVTGKADEQKKAETAYQTADAAKTQAIAAKDAAAKGLTDLNTQLDAATKAAQTAEAAVATANQAAEAKPDDVALRQAADQAAVQATNAIKAVADLLTKKMAAVADLQTKSTAVGQSTVAANGAKAALDTAIAAKATADKAAADAATALKAAMDAEVAAKANAEKAVAAATLTPEQQKQLQDTEAAAKAGTDRVAALKGKVEFLQAAAARATQTAAAQ